MNARVGQIVLEITEHGIPDGLGLTALKFMAERGVRVALDDVMLSGTNLALLTRCNFSMVKLSAELTGEVRIGLPAPEWLDGLRSLLHSSSLTVVAEGVETGLSSAFAAGSRRAVRAGLSLLDAASFARDVRLPCCPSRGCRDEAVDERGLLWDSCKDSGSTHPCPTVSPHMKTSRAFLAGSIALLAAHSLQAAPKTHRLEATPSTVAYGYYWSEAKPVLRIASGDIIDVDTLLTNNPTGLAARRRRRRQDPGVAEGDRRRGDRRSPRAGRAHPDRPGVRRRRASRATCSR